MQGRGKGDVRKRNKKWKFCASQNHRKENNPYEGEIKRAGERESGGFGRKKEDLQSTKTHQMLAPRCLCT
jgi:hypothetical protein